MAACSRSRYPCTVSPTESSGSATYADKLPGKVEHAAAAAIDPVNRDPHGLGASRHPVRYGPGCRIGRR